MSVSERKSSVLTILMYLFKNQKTLLDVKEDEKVVDNLKDAGFGRDQIREAMDWLSQLNEQYSIVLSQNCSNLVRVYLDIEKEVINTHCRAFLAALVDIGILTNKTKEIVIVQVMALRNESVDIHLVKWVVLLVLLAQPEDKQALNRMLLYMHGDSAETVH